MGFYLRKSVKAGPFRFNLSKSGLGVSAGVPGFRVGSGPRGNYVQMGAGGLNYRSTLSTRGRNAAARPVTHRANYVPLRHDIVMEDTTGADVHQLEPTGQGDIVEQLNKAARHRGWAWPATIAIFILGAATMPWGLVIWLLGAAASIWLFLLDKSKRSVVVFYDVTDADEAWFESVVDAAQMAASSQRLWRIVQSGTVNTTYQHKTNAGAGHLVNRQAAAFTFNGPRNLATNISVPSITAGKTSIHFLPDRLLVKEGRTYTDIAYSTIRIASGATRFIESGGNIPKDAQQVDRTWQYVNVKGGPDRRFANNPVRPIMLYGELDLSTQSGFHWAIQTSLTVGSSRLDNALRAGR